MPGRSSRNSGRSGASRYSGPTRTIQKSRKINIFDSTQASFWSNSKTPKGYQRFDKLLSPGWIREPVSLGVLTNVRDEQFRVIFEFDLNGYKFDAWSSKKSQWGLKNMALLKTQHSYVIEENKQYQIKADKKTAKYSSASNSVSSFEMMLADIKVTEEEKCAYVATSNEKSLREMSQLIARNQTFTLKTGELTIVSGEVRRYMGCVVCHAGMSRPKANGKFACKICKRTCSKNERKVCMIIRNLEVKDSTGTILSNVICFHSDCETLFGSQVVLALCAKFSDLDARKVFEDNVVGKSITATIKHAKVTKKDQRAFAAYKTTLCEITVLNTTPSTRLNPNEDNQEEPLYSDDDDSMGTSLADTSSAATRGKAEVSTSPVNTSQATPPTTKRLVKDSGEVYKLFPVNGHIGLAVVINISKNREGSEHNVDRLREMFAKLDVRVYGDKAFDVQTRKDLGNLIKNVKKELILQNYSSFFFVFMSHGKLYSVQLGDSTLISVHGEIIPYFSEDRFEEFAGKPKIFIFQACQTFGTEQFYVGDNEIIPEVLECYSCGPGVLSKRSKSGVSPFISTLAEVFEETRTTWHIEEMMKEVQQRMSRIPQGSSLSGIGNAINVPVYKPMLFSKRFYFASKDVIDAYLENMFQNALTL